MFFETFPGLKAILETMIRLPKKKAALLIIVSDMRKGKITAKFQNLKSVLIEDAKEFMSPEKVSISSRNGGPISGATLLHQPNGAVLSHQTSWFLTLKTR